MLTVTINISGAGTPLASGGSSTGGHMWYSLHDGASLPTSYGFGPVEHGDPKGPGKPFNSDNGEYLTTDYQKIIEITQAQYDAMKNFGEHPENYGFDMEYDFMRNSCIDFTWKGLQEAGMNPNGFQGDVIPTNNIDDIEELLDQSNDLFDGFVKDMGTDLSIKDITDAVRDFYDTAKDYIFRKDPLTFDLDGDGIETVGISATNPILFDHDGDGIKNGTGWIKPDDAMLVLDRNGNGTIDNGRELFGDSTIKSNGQTATDGFDALADLDSNNDGLVSAADAQFASLRLWRDLNQDGISQSGELFSLSSQGIVSINVASTAQSVTLRNGNELADMGSFTRVDGSAGALGSVTGKLGDVNLSADTFHRHFPDTLNTASVKHLPNMQGSGAVNDKDWRVAA